MKRMEKEQDELRKVLKYCLENPIISYILLKQKLLTPKEETHLLALFAAEKEKQPEESHPSASGTISPIPKLQNTSPKNMEIMKNAIHFITENYAYRITLPDVASEAHLNPAYFSSLFKQSTGISFKEYLNLVRIEESKRLLITTEFSIIDIAIGIGFEDQSYFSKVFKKYTGVTPKQFRYTFSSSSPSPSS